VRAVDSLAKLDSTRVIRVSSLYKTAPVESSGPDYFNAVAAISTALNAPTLLSGLQRIEMQAGRERPYPNAPRTLDLDLLFYGDARIESARLTVPHPRLFDRAFVLMPLAEIAPDRVSPGQLDAVAHQINARIGSL
jgi:2-amino-4-hydroxy-6-hydroxymethyldihydropteridine diphosphokinase